MSVWQGVMEFLSPKSLEEREEGLEKRAQLLESRAEFVEREAALRKRVAVAERRIKASSPKSNLLYVLVGLAALVLIVLVIKGC